MFAGPSVKNRVGYSMNLNLYEDAELHVRYAVGCLSDATASVVFASCMSYVIFRT